ncbi:MAG: hypothetical protein F6K23_27195 [Okeania sp. SIO2C9]|uniref:hypothetical protein n=1 Tax=Okeania sp. SIO2C9 TaxID=2607791 RepID=UPI0013C0DC96|nr:hypothetical protein [Okeania sp. SIO2C9]NEQ76399.1 hypothetical protein [Okeania sp. SIO2C9]
MTEEHSFPYGYEANIPVDNPGKRQVILVLPTGMPERIKYDSAYRKLRDSILIKNTNKTKNGLCIVEESIDLYDESSQSFLQSLQQKGLIEPGNILIQNAYNPNDYLKFDAEKIKTEVIFTKWQHYTIVAGYLGAKKVELINQKDRESDSNKDFNLKSSFSIFDLFNIGGESFTKSVEKKLYKISAEFKGSLPDIESAKQYISENFLSQDKDINFLVKNREKNNLMVSFEQNSNLFSQIENGFSLAMNIKVPEYLVDGKGEYKQTNKKIEKFITKVVLTFSES